VKKIIIIYNRLQLLLIFFKILHPKNNISSSDLIEFLQVNSIDLILGDTIDVKSNGTKGILCKRCRRWCAEENDELCERCDKIIQIFY